MKEIICAIKGCDNTVFNSTKDKLCSSCRKIIKKRRFKTPAKIAYENKKFRERILSGDKGPGQSQLE